MLIDIWLLEYGLAAVFFLLALGIIGLPIPDETIIVLAGALVAKGKMQLVPILLAVYGGTIVGITVSYVLGYTCGRYIIPKFGPYIGITSVRIAHTKKWFKDIGKWLLFFGYFILGLRHLTGLVAGLIKLEFKQFALFAYSGGIIWASCVFSIGYFFSHNWHKQLNTVSIVAIIVALITFAGIYGFFFYRIHNRHDSQ
jgi:membrane protein DedA with SNARE-associated domain